MSGGFNPHPLKFGGQGKSHLEELFLDALLEADGTALSKETSSYVYAERLAEARALAYAAGINQRLAYLWDPERLTSTLSRWESILQITPPPGLSEPARRARVLAHFRLYGTTPTGSAVADLLTSVIPDVFTSVVHTSSTDAGGSVPGGATVPGGVTLPDGDWRSTIAYLAIELIKPGTMSEAEFYEQAGEVFGLLEGFLPAWTTVDWFRDGVGGAGFFLDEDHNLDNQRFD